MCAIAKWAILVAGGVGSRMNVGSLPKQFLLLNGKSILWHSLHTFLRAYDDIQIVLVMVPEYKTLAAEIVATLDLLEGQSIQIIDGGSTRFFSVKNGLGVLPTNEEAIVFVHDVARCLLSTSLIHRCYATAVEYGSAVPVVTATDSIRIEDAENNYSVDREKIKIVQTPQTFQSKVLIPAFAQEYSEQFTDEASVVDALGLQIQLVDGEYSNIKITRPMDLVVAEHIIQRQS